MRLDHHLYIRTVPVFLSICVFFALATTIKAQTLSKSIAPPIKLVALGDSLTAGYGLAADDSYPVRLEALLRRQNFNVQIINAGVSGDTTKAGLERLDWALPKDAQGVLLALGANDALRGIAPKHTRINLERLLEKLKQKRLKVLLIGMEAPRNLGADYVGKFGRIYKELAQKHQVLLHPFLLQGIATVPELNQSDGIHPNKRGVEIMVQQLAPAAKRLIEQIRQAK